MSDVIHLLPDSVANQIAAGEVVQRPASVVKELLENAVDAGADDITLIVKEAGSTLIQVIDNGKGMSITDARMSLERHATSKIESADDLFHLRTMGFRGEALASIVAVAQCELKTKKLEEELGTRIVVEGSEIITQEPCTGQPGTSVMVKNLFYNIPARRKFLKSKAVENRHIIDQFERVAIIYPDIKFTFVQDETTLFKLERGTLRQRIVAIFGKNYNDRLVPLSEETSLVNLTGFVCKPEFARKKRDGQFLFVNQRFIKSNYLHHGILSAYEELLPKGMHPSYFIHLECDPESIDVNIHPTKTEIKFEEEKSIYAILRSTVKKALGEHNIAPSIDFNRETAFDHIPQNKEVVEPKITVNPDYNPFESSGAKKRDYSSAGQPFERPKTSQWETLVKAEPQLVQQDLNFESLEKEFEIEPSESGQRLDYKVLQIDGKYIISPLKSGLIVVHQRRAHERILFERNLRALAMNQGLSQKSLFPETLEFSAKQSQVLQSLLEDFHLLGFEMEEFGKNTFIVRAVPTHVGSIPCSELIEDILQSFEENEQKLELKTHVNLAYSMARKESITSGRKLNSAECVALLDELFACENPHTSISGKPIVYNLGLDELNKRFD
jgi:DNA mismatch repair protein MutL